MKILVSFLSGLITWPILEYILHRFMGHTWKVKTLFKIQHTRHHVETNYFAPTFYKILAAIPACSVLFVLTALLSGSWPAALGFTSGFIMMYAVYEWAHWSFHATAPKTRLGMQLRKHHFTHHFHNAKMNHGVTSTLIDKIAGTFLEVPVVEVPKNIALPWLFEPGQNNIHARFSKYFQFR